jgi:uncharacterized protein (TIGR03067 family)
MSPVLLIIVATIGAPAAKEAKKDPPSIVGVWAVESAVEAGKPDNPPAGTTWTFTAGGKSVLFVPGEKEQAESSFTTDAKRSPAWFDVAADRLGDPIRGIFKVEGDTLTLCFVDEKGAERPTAFESPAGSKAVLVTLKRTKAKD